MNSLCLEIKQASKRFPGVLALDKADFKLKKGSIHALLGENGAGKSTLIKIITGLYKQDSGKLLINNLETTLNSPTEAQNRGISVVHQERNLIRRFSVGENLLLNDLPKNKFGLINYKLVFEKSEEWLKLMDLNIDPRTLVSDLTVAKMQLCEIAKALSIRSKILLLDEPTSSLSPQETEHLFTVLQRIVREEDVSIVFVSHKLEEVFELCDQVTVLRDGKNACNSESINKLDRQNLVKLMIGREEQIIKPKTKVTSKQKTILRLEKINTELGHQDINLTLSKGEIIGLYGLVGSGRTELAKCLLGLEKIVSGQIKIDGNEVKIDSPKTALDRFKIGYISEDRKKEGLILIHNVLENAGITIWSKIKVFMSFLSDKAIHAKVDPFIRELEVKTPSYSQLVSNLSGGNQQKISVVKWLAAGTDVLIIDEPTVGIDIKTKSYIHELILELAKKGTSIVLISSDMPEMISLADKVVVMKNFKIEGNEANTHNYADMSNKIMAYIHD